MLEVPGRDGAAGMTQHLEPAMNTGGVLFQIDILRANSPATFELTADTWFLVAALSIYAIGSSQLAAFRSGVPVARTKILAYAIGGLFAAMGGLSLTMSTGIGAPIPGPYLMASVAAVVLGGVVLGGGKGSLLGPIIAVFILRLVRTDLTLLAIDPNVAAIVAKGGPFSGLICEGCAEACKRCGEACEKFKDDPMMKDCAEECRKCEKACREMLKHAKGGDRG